MNGVGERSGAPLEVGEDAVVEISVTGLVTGSEATDFSCCCCCCWSCSSEDCVGTFFSEGKKVLMTGLDSRPTRPSCTALDVVLIDRHWVSV